MSCRDSEHHPNTAGESVGAATIHAGDIFPPDTDDLVDDAPAAVVLRLNPLELARYEALIERIHKTRIGGRRMSREESHLMALELLAAGPTRDAGSVPRGTAPYRIVIYTCGSCGRATVQTNRGSKKISAGQCAAASCDAIIERSGEKNAGPRKHALSRGPSHRAA